MALTPEQIVQAEAVLQVVEQFLPANIRPYVADLLVDGPLGLQIYAEIKTAAAALPTPVTAVAIVAAFGPVLPKLAQLVDQVIAQEKALTAKTPTP